MSRITPEHGRAFLSEVIRQERDIIGHEGKDVHDKFYRKGSSTIELLKAIEAIPDVTNPSKG